MHKAHKTVFRRVLIHKGETWRILRKVERDLLERADMIMLVWMMGIQRTEKIRAEGIRARAGVANYLSEKIREATLRLLGHVKKRQWKM